MKLVTMLLTMILLCSCAEQRAQHYYDKGLWAVNEDNYEEAIINYRKAIEILPSFDYARLDLGGMLVTTGKLEEAKQQFEYIVENSPDFIHAYEYLGLVYTKEQNYKKAEEMYRLALSIDPTAPIQWELGNVLLKQNKFEEAQEALEKEKNMMSGLRKDYHLAMAKALDGQGKHEEARLQEQLASEVE